MDELQEYTKQVLGISLTKTQRKAFQVYEQELIQWNAKYNLTAIDAPEKIKTKHFLDSLTCLSVINDEKSLSIIDVGTGAGFPGMILAIALPETEVTLVEPLTKRAGFLQFIKADLLSISAACLVLKCDVVRTKELNNSFRGGVSWVVFGSRGCFWIFQLIHSSNTIFRDIITKTWSIKSFWKYYRCNIFSKFFCYSIS